MYTYTKDDFDGIIVTNAKGEVMANITGCTDEFLAEALAAPDLLQWLIVADDMLKQAMKHMEFTLGACRNMTEISAAITKALGQS